MADPEGLFAANHQRLFRYFCRAVGRAEAARDLTQEVFLRVSRTPIPVAANGDLRGWLFRIARNLALDHHRKRLRHPDPTLLVDEPTRPRPRMSTWPSTRPSRRSRRLTATCS